MVLKCGSGCGSNNWPRFKMNIKRLKIYKLWFWKESFFENVKVWALFLITRFDMKFYLKILCNFVSVRWLVLRQSVMRRRPVLVDAVRLGHRVHQDHGLSAEPSITRVLFRNRRKRGQIKLKLPSTANYDWLRKNNHVCKLNY